MIAMVSLFVQLGQDKTFCILMGQNAVFTWQIETSNNTLSQKNSKTKKNNNFFQDSKTLNTKFS